MTGSVRLVTGRLPRCCSDFNVMSNEGLVSQGNGPNRRNESSLGVIMRHAIPATLFLLALLLAGCSQPSGSNQASATPDGSATPKASASPVVASPLPLTEEFKPIFEAMARDRTASDPDPFAPAVEAVKSHPEVALMVDEDGNTLLNKTLQTSISARHIEPQKEVVRVLLENGADPNHPNYQQMPPLAQRSLSPGVVTLLLEHGADPNSRAESGLTALMQAWDADSARVLLEHGADVKLADGSGRTALHHAAGNRSEAGPAIVQALVDAGADVSQTDEGGNTPLHLAASAGETESAKILIGKGAKNVPNKKGETPLQLAKERHNEDVAALLKDLK